MIAYDKTRLFHLRLLKKAKQWYVRQLLSAEQFATINQQYKADFYTPGLFITIGLFLFTWMSIIAATGLLAMIFSPAFGSDAAITFICLLLSAGCTLVLEKLIKERKLHRAGIDEALLYAAIIFIACAIGNFVIKLVQ